MKKMLTIASAAALAVFVGSALDWSNVENMAKGATVTVSSRSEQAATITDGDLGSSWQALPETHNYTHDWALIDLGAVKDFTDIEILWEASHPTKYSVYVSEDEIPFTEETYTVGEEDDAVAVSYNKIDEEWLASATAFAEGGEVSEAGFTETISKEGQGRYILVYADEYNNFSNQYGCRIFEVRVGKIEGRDNITSLSLNGATVSEGESAEVTVKALTILGDEADLAKVEDLVLTCSAPAAVEITAGEYGVYTVKGLQRGTYTLTATGKINGEELTATATFTVAFNWTGLTNIATGKEVVGRYKEDSSILAPAVDGDGETYYEYDGNWGGGDGWLVVDLGGLYIINAVGAEFVGSAGMVEFGYATESTRVSNDEAWKGAEEGWTFTGNLSRTPGITTYSFDKAVLARYIAVRDQDNPGGKPQLKEIYAAGEEYVQPYAASLEVSATPAGLFAGETATVEYAVLDQYGNIFSTENTPAITVEGADYENGTITATKKGAVTISASYGDLTAETAITVADEADYCMAGATVTSDNADADGKLAIDGGSNPANLGGIYVVKDGEAAGAAEHWILADLHKPYDLDMIIAAWEGACPADYDVYVGETEETLVKLYSYTGHDQAITYVDRFSGKEMKNVQYIKIVTTKNATGYGIKLYDMKAYGQSNVESVPTTVTISAADNHISTAESVKLTAAVLDQFGAELPDAEITFTATDGATVENGVFTATAKGVYEVTAFCGEIESEPIEINVAAEENTKIVPTHTVKHGDDTEFSSPLSGTVTNPALDTPLEIAFTNNCTFTLIKLRWEAACPSDYTVVVEYADGSKATVLEVKDRKFQGGFNPVDRIVSTTGNSAKMRANALGSGSLTNVKKITVLPTAKDHGYNLQLYGIDLYGTEGSASSINFVGAEEADALVDVYTTMGVRVRAGVAREEATAGLPAGLYIVGGQKVVVK